ncbi:MAG: YkgJ family cysteine cluster protein [Bacteroidota bacterium]
MKHLESDTKKIALLGEQNEEENFDFRIFLKGQDKKRVDRIVHRLDAEIRSQIDCQKCGNCCKIFRPCVTDREIDKLSKLAKHSRHDFEKHYVEIDNFDNVKYLKDTPCIFLNGNSCSIYKDMPEDCKSYPHTHKPGFISRTLGLIDDYGICPIVFNVFERLKLELGYK